MNDTLNYDCCGGLFPEGISRYSCSPPPSPVRQHCRSIEFFAGSQSRPLSAVYLQWRETLTQWSLVNHSSLHLADGTIKITAERRASWHITRAGKQPVTVEPAAALHHSSSATVYDPSQAGREWERSPEIQKMTHIQWNICCVFGFSQNL